MKRILIISLIFTLLLSGCGYTEDERELLNRKAEGIGDKFFLDMCDCLMEISYIETFNRLEPFYENANKIINKHIYSHKKLNEREKEILAYMVEAIDAEKEYMENDFSLKYSVQITDALKGLTELMLDIEVEDRDQ